MPDQMPLEAYVAEGRRIPKVGERWLFRPHEGTSDLGPHARAKAGETVLVRAVYDKPDRDHDEEVLPMFRIEFDEDPTDIGDLEVWLDELEAVDGSN